MATRDGTIRELARLVKWTLLALLVVGCEGPAGPPGSTGPAGSAGDGGSGGTMLPWSTSPDVALVVTDLAFTAQVATVSFTLTDGSGIGVDPTGMLTTGTVALGFVVSQLAQNPDGTAGQYTAYTTHTQTSPVTGASAIQATTEATGTLRAIDRAHGTYQYDVAAPLTGLDPALTQTVGAFAIRPGASAITSTTFSARPDHGAVLAREVVTAGACDSCHRTLDGHGGRWTKPEQCVLCHQPQSSDPDTGNTVDFKVMIHKVHRGGDLPSVIAGTPYQIIGYNQSVNDWSTVGFPQNIARCTACHAGAEGDRWKTAPAKAACTSCHDTTSFELPVPTGMVPHGGGAQPDNAMCAVCHPGTGSLAGIADKHLTGLLAPDALVVDLQIVSMTNTAPGQAPVMTFTAKVDGVARDLVAQPLTSLTATIAGPTTDITTEWQAKVQGAGAVGALAAVDAATGTFSYTFPATTVIPVAATGSYQVALDGYLQPSPTAPRYAALNPVLPFAVTGATVVPRRTIVDRALCNSCHFDLAAHGGTRKNTAYCVMCHSPGGFDSAGAPRFQATQNVAAPSIDFRRMIHKIHRGEELTRPYILGGFPLPSITKPGGTPIDFSDIRYPRKIIECEACHATKNWVLPMMASTAYAPTQAGLMGCAAGGGTDPTQFCPAPFWTVTSVVTISPATAVCTSCHDSSDVAAHAELNTTSGGVEACATCHGAGAAYDVGALHGLAAHGPP
jgi:OmcA/MtrC family decaheme c-type cytochrome